MIIISFRLKNFFGKLKNLKKSKKVAGGSQCAMGYPPLKLADFGKLNF